MNAPLASPKMSVDKAMSLLFPDRDKPYTILRAAMKYPSMVRDEPPAEVFEILDKIAVEDPRHVADLVVALAALVDITRTPSQMLAWMCNPGEIPRPRLNERLCGTMAGHIYHTNADEEPCPPCAVAYAEASTACPSPAAYYRHLRAGQKPCRGCVVEIRAYWVRTKKRNPVTVRKNRAKCGTRHGYERHKREGDTACDECVEAYRAYFRERGRAKRGSTGESLAEINRRNAVALRSPCGTLQAKRRHQRDGNRCDVCWPTDQPEPRWYGRLPDPAPVELPAVEPEPLEPEPLGQAA